MNLNLSNEWAKNQLLDFRQLKCDIINLEDNSMAKKKRAFIYKDDKSDKFWTIEVSGASYTIVYGKTGTRGQAVSKDFDSAEDCIKAAEKVIKQKVGKGYVEK